MITGGTIVGIIPREHAIMLNIIDSESNEECLLRIGRTNYRLAEGDFVRWDEKNAYWTSQFRPEPEVILFNVGVTQNRE